MNLEKINKYRQITKILSIITTVIIFADLFVFNYLYDAMIEAQASKPCLGIVDCLATDVGDALSGIGSFICSFVIFANFVLSVGNTVLVFFNNDNKLLAPLILTIIMTLTTTLSFILNGEVFDLLTLVQVILVIIMLIYIIKTRTLVKMDKIINTQVTQQVTYQDNSVQPMAMPNQVVEQPAMQQPVAQVVEQQPVVQSQPQQVQHQPTTTQPVQPQQPNTMIDLNNLTPEQKDQLLTVLLQNNQKTNE